MATILVIDDKDLVRYTLRRQLEEAGHSVFEAANGALGLREQERVKAEIIITDIVMPEKEGIETILEIRRAWPSVKVIAISGGGRVQNLDLLKLAGEVGACCTLSKPVELDVLLSAVDGCLQEESTENSDT